MQEKLELRTVEEMTQKYLEMKEELALKNWNYTMESIERNFFDGNKVAWSSNLLNPEQVEELQKAGYKVTESSSNNCHKITW